MEIDRSYARIHLDNLVFNYKQAKNLVGENTKVMAVVKADAYGHGAVKCSRRLEKNGCDFFAVASIEEAIELRENGIDSDILIFGRTSIINHCYLSKYNLIQTVYSFDYAKQLNNCNEEIRIHINIDTGMSRFGIYLHDEKDIERVVSEIKEIQNLENLIYEGIYTHFATSDEDNKKFCDQQYKLYKSLIKKLDSEGIKTGVKHVANSGAIVSHNDKYLDMVRFGIGLYGYPHTRETLELKPVMEVFSHVTSTREIKPGDTVSYGRTYKTKDVKKIATIAIGYADGYNRLLSNKDYLIYKNKKLPVIGRVCMDAIMVDIGNLTIEDGEVVEVFGLNKPLEHICEVINTIPYEVLCNVSKRVQRLYD
ncbi:MAG: alanine racemase [Tenericutes bacterium]|nr:alanine racemase [Mycoplasmatota bacterium]